MSDVVVNEEPDKVRRYVKFTESNEWEGETWHFYIPIAGNEEAIALLREKIADPDFQDPEGDPLEYVLAEEELTEVEVDTLVRHGDIDGYMPEHNKLQGRIDSGMIRERRDFYKGAIRDCLRQ